MIKNFDDYCAVEDALCGMDYRAGDWCPTSDEVVDFIEKHPDREEYMPYLMWIYNTYDGEKTDEVRESRNYINLILSMDLEEITNKEEES